MLYMFALAAFVYLLCVLSYLAGRSIRKRNVVSAALEASTLTWPIPTDPPPGDPAETPVFQVSVQNTATAPKWYAPGRDLLNCYPQIVRNSLARLEVMSMPSSEYDRVCRMAQAMGKLHCRVVEREFKGKQDALMAELKAIQESDPYAFSLVGASLLSTMTYWFWREYSAAARS